MPILRLLVLQGQQVLQVQIVLFLALLVRKAYRVKSAPLDLQALKVQIALLPGLPDLPAALDQQGLPDPRAALVRLATLGPLVLPEALARLALLVLPVLRVRTPLLLAPLARRELQALPARLAAPAQPDPPS